MRTLLMTVAIALSGPALAQQPPAYLDDRSSAGSVIASLYNAINRGEYLRAYSYYGANAGIGSFETFSKGYANTANVSVLTGKAQAEGAAGSTFYTLPVAIDALGTNGRHKQFAGCYTLRLANPAIQATPPFVPLHIEKGSLKPASGSLKSILPSQCS